MKITHLQAIEALGNLICFYNSDLKYITKFHEFKNDKITEEEYLKNKNGFQKFINEYRVTRNIKKHKVKNCMIFTKEWVLKENPLDVDKFAQDLKKEDITQDGKIMTSLASKILFLNNPEKLIPIDTLNKKALGQKINLYKEFIDKVGIFKSANNDLIKKYLNIANLLFTEVEENHKSIKISFDVYRITRYTDKLLWTKGKE